MRLVLQLARQDLQLARAEAESLFAVAEAPHPELLVAEGDARLLQRLVLTRYAGKLLAATKSLEGLSLPSYKSFAIRVSSVADVDQGAIIRAVAQKVKGKVDLENPKAVIRVFTDGTMHWITEEKYEYSTKPFACRDVNARLVFHPTSLQPKYGRLLLNLSGVKKGEVLDPFCGVGGILLEAADMGLKATGIEISEEYAEGARDNAWFYKMEKRVRVEQADFLKWESKKKFGAVVTDLPYGKSSGLFGRSREELYLGAFMKMKRLAPRLVVMAHEDLTPLLEKAGWKVEKKFDFYVHKTMQRYIHKCNV